MKGIAIFTFHMLFVSTLGMAIGITMFPEWSFVGWVALCWLIRFSTELLWCGAKGKKIRPVLRASFIRAGTISSTCTVVWLITLGAAHLSGHLPTNLFVNAVLWASGSIELLLTLKLIARITPDAAFTRYILGPIITLLEEKLSQLFTKPDKTQEDDASDEE